MVRFWAEVVGEETEHIYGGGEQYTYLDLKGRRYPIWVREQGVGRNKSSIVTIAMDLALHGGGDYHTTYWPQASYLSSRKYYIGTAELEYYREHSLCTKVQPSKSPRSPATRSWTSARATATPSTGTTPCPSWGRPGRSAQSATSPSSSNHRSWKLSR